MKNAKYTKLSRLHLLSLLFLLILVPLGFLAVQKLHGTRAAGAMPYVKGNQIMDGFGNPLILKGAHIQSLLDKTGSVVTISDTLAMKHLNSATFDVMVNNWNMNAVRIATGDYMWQKHWPGGPAAYISTLQNAVAQANQSGLYVILSMHEDPAAGLPQSEPCGVGMPSATPTSVALSYWQTVAAAFKNNPMVMFDLYNEPHVAKLGTKLTEPDWQFWLKGGYIKDEVAGCSNAKSYQVLGLQTLVNAIRAQGANQIIIAEGLANSFQTFESSCPSGQTHCNFLQDPNSPSSPNIVYSVHQYFLPEFRSQSSWDARFGYLESQVPVFIGEWQFSINSAYPVRCDEPNSHQSMTPDEATALVESFLTYMDQHQTSWTTFAFTFSQLITGTGPNPQQNTYTNYVPTTLYTNPSWTCGQPDTSAGDGQLIKGYLLSGLQSFTPTPTP
jgi:endoglucanase